MFSLISISALYDDDSLVPVSHGREGSGDGRVYCGKLTWRIWNLIVIVIDMEPGKNYLLYTFNSFSIFF